MTLRNKLKTNVSINTDGEAGRFASQCEKIADEFAIEVLEYYHNGLFFIPLKDGEAKKILEYIKKEKGL